MCDPKIREWVELVLKHEDFLDLDVKVHKKTSKADGYLGDITFVTATIHTKNHETKCWDFVIKSSKESMVLKKQAPMREAFQKEIYMYEQFKPVFEQFQRDCGLDIMKIMPHCYVTRIRNNDELLILENLQKEGFSVWDRMTAMPLDLTTLVLEAYGKWHAVSIALKSQKPEIFNKLTENNINLFSYFIMKARVIDAIASSFQCARQKLNLDHKKNVSFDKIDIEEMFSEMYLEDPNYHVILHGDCWNNNYMFTFRNGKAEEIRVIDWQCSGLASPVFDLAFFIYCCCSEADINDVDKLLRIYYNHLADYLRQMGSDPEKLFPWEKLQEHWRRFARFGLVVSTFMLKFCLSDADDCPDFMETAEAGRDFCDNFNITLKNEAAYLERMRINFSQYTQYNTD